MAASSLGERYLSTPLVGDISVDMNEEERNISNSTPAIICRRRRHELPWCFGRVVSQVRSA
jgi:hypothetical protein